MSGNNENRKPLDCSCADLQLSSATIYCGRARDLNNKDSSQTTGAVAVRVLTCINTAEEKEIVPVPWQTFWGRLIYFEFVEYAVLNGWPMNSCYLFFLFSTNK